MSNLTVTIKDTIFEERVALMSRMSNRLGFYDAYVSSLLLFVSHLIANHVLKLLASSTMDDSNSQASGLSERDGTLSDGYWARQ